MTITLPRVQKAVADYYKFNVAQIKSHVMHKSLNKARAIAIFLARKMTAASSTEIGAAFDRDHTSILSTMKRAEQMIASDPTVSAEVELIRRQLQALERIAESEAGTLPTPAVNIHQCPTCGQTVVDAAEKQKIAATLRMGMAALEQGVKMLERS